MNRKRFVNKVLQVSRKIIKIVVICTLILVATGSKVNITSMEAKKTEILLSNIEEKSRVTWVDSTELDENGQAKQVPVPKGFTASQIEGETTVSGGFVIYEGEIDWSKIIVEEVEETEISTIIDEKKVNEGTEQNILIKQDEEILKQEDSLKEEQKIEDEIINKQKTIDDTILTKEIEALSEIESILDEPTEQENTGKTTTEVTQTEINIFNLQKTTNQYVWVPVEDVSEIYGVDANGKMWGKIYDFNSSGRSAKNWSETNGIMSIITAINYNYREPEVASTMTQWDIDSLLPEYISGQSRYELLTKEIEQNFYETIKSIKKYGGFYIGRYETGGLNGTPVVQKMNTNIANQTWYTMYNKCKQLGKSNGNVTTSMISGTLWDITLEWFVDSLATNSNGTPITYSLVGSDSTTWGNYYNATFDYITPTAITPLETAIKVEKTTKTIPTGSAEYTKVNNIYDMAGNVSDWTIESYHIGNRAFRGGHSSPNYVKMIASYRNSGWVSSKSVDVGCRVQLLIK